MERKTAPTAKRLRDQHIPPPDISRVPWEGFALRSLKNLVDFPGNDFPAVKYGRNIIDGETTTRFNGYLSSGIYLLLTFRVITRVNLHLGPTCGKKSKDNSTSSPFILGIVVRLARWFPTSSSRRHVLKTLPTCGTTIRRFYFIINDPWGWNR